MIVMTMTSYPKRIHNCYQVLQSALNQTIKADSIYLNLAEIEFPNKEKDLPENLLKLIKTEPKLILNWVKGPNTKAMKKVFPILDFLHDDDIILHFDDDTTLPKDLLESRLNDFKNNGYNHPISSFSHYENDIKGVTVGPTTIYKKSMLAGWKQFLTKEILATGHDDRTYKWLFFLNGYIPLAASKYRKGSYIGGLRSDLDDGQGLTRTSSYSKGNDYDRLVVAILSKKYKNTDKACYFRLYKTGKLYKKPNGSLGYYGAFGF